MWRTEFQNASVVCPDSVRPDASVIVPEIITGNSTPRRAKCPLDANDGRFRIERVENRLDQEEIDTTIDQRNEAVS